MLCIGPIKIQRASKMVTGWSMQLRQRRDNGRRMRRAPRKAFIKAQCAIGLNPYPKYKQGLSTACAGRKKIEPPWYLEIGVSPQTAQSSAILGPRDPAALKKLPSVAVGYQRMTSAQARAVGR